jgi:energy-coupling factor transporter ATP-binding protein EcfA2
MLLQDPTLGFLTTTVNDEVSYGSNLNSTEVARILDRFNLTELKSHSPFKLSEGEKRRLAIATAMAQNPELIILDEPTAGMDGNHIRLVTEEINSFPGTLIQITHDPRIVEQSNFVIMLENGCVSFSGPPQKMTSDQMYRLGFHIVSATADLAMKSLQQGIPLTPKNLEVTN